MQLRWQNDFNKDYQLNNKLLKYIIAFSREKVFTSFLLQLINSLMS
jgi:hypothetical protein